MDGRKLRKHACLLCFLPFILPLDDHYDASGECLSTFENANPLSHSHLKHFKYLPQTPTCVCACVCVCVCVCVRACVCVCVRMKESVYILNAPRAALALALRTCSGFSKKSDRSSCECCHKSTCMYTYIAT